MSTCTYRTLIDTATAFAAEAGKRVVIRIGDISWTVDAAGIMRRA